MKRLLILLLCIALLVPAFGQTVKRRPLVPSGGGGADFVTDSYTETSNTTLISHTPELGGAPVRHGDTTTYNDTAQVIGADDRVHGFGNTAYYYDVAPPSADYYVQADFFIASVISVNTAIAGRMDTSVNTMYVARINNGTSWELRKIVTGTQTTLGSPSTNQIPSVGNSATVRLVMTGSNISLMVNGVTEVGPVSDSAITAAGRAGVRFIGVQSSTTGYHLDNFSAR
jgi:hypothetical protein